MQRSFEDNWNVQLSDEELKLLSEFRAADQILASLKLLVVTPLSFRAQIQDLPKYTSR